MLRCARAPRLRGALLLLVCLVVPLSATAITVGLELLVTVNDQPGVSTAFGGPDASTNTPLLLAVSPGDEIQISVLIDFGLPMREYQTSITTEDPASVDYVDGSALDISTLGFSALADPDDTLQDGDPDFGEADSNLCPIGTCTAPSSNTLYELSFVVDAGFVVDGLRDITIAIDSILFGRNDPPDLGTDELDPLRDTASIQLVPEPSTAALLGAALLALAAGRARRAS